jgi:hypothetical protein
MIWKTLIAVLSLGCGLAGFRCSAAEAARPEVLYRHRFIGADAVQGLLTAPKALEILSNTNSLSFRRLAVERFGRWLAGQAGNPGAEISGLADALEMVLPADSVVEFRQADGGWAALLAAKLPEDAAKQFEEKVGGIAAALGLGKEGRPNANISVQRDAGWSAAVVSLGLAVTPEQMKSWLGEGRKTPADTNASVLRLNADLPKLAKVFGWPEYPVRLGRLELALSSQGEYLKTAGKIAYPEALRWNTAKWNIPTNLIRDPLICFTALRGLGPLATTNGALADILGKGLTGSQSFMWTMSQVPFQSYLVMAANDPKTELNRLGDVLPNRFNTALAAANSGQIGWNSNRTEVKVNGLAIVAPFIKATNDLTGSWLVAGLFPIVPNPQPPPGELLSQLTGRDNLVAYDWEITQERIGYWRIFSQLAPIVGRTSSATNDRAALRVSYQTTERFLEYAGSNLGNTITEVVASGPNELSLTRKSHLGLSGFELVRLARWLADSPSSIIAAPGALPTAVPAVPGKGP